MLLKSTQFFYVFNFLYHALLKINAYNNCEGKQNAGMTNNYKLNIKQHVASKFLTACIRNKSSKEVLQSVLFTHDGCSYYLCHCFSIF